MLDKIVADKKEELKQRKKAVPVSGLESRIAQRAGTLDFAAALKKDASALSPRLKEHRLQEAFSAMISVPWR